MTETAIQFGKGACVRGHCCHRAMSCNAPAVQLCTLVHEHSKWQYTTGNTHILAIAVVFTRVGPI